MATKAKKAPGKKSSAKVKKAPAKKADKKAPAKKADAKATPESGEGTTSFSTTGKKKANARFAHEMPMSKIAVEKGFNPRTDLGDISTLQTSIKKSGLDNPLTVRPNGKQFTIISGHRRFAALQALNHSTTQVIIRDDLEGEDTEALALALAENSEDGRKNLSYIELGAKFKVLEADGMTINQIASKTAYHAQTVRRALAVMDAPKDVRDRVQEGKLSASAALELARLDKGVRNKIADELDDFTSAKRVKELGKAAARADGKAATDGKASNRKKGKDRDASAVIWKGSREKQAEIQWLARSITDARADEEFDADDFEYHQTLGALTALLWSRGDLAYSVLPNMDELPEGVTKTEAQQIHKLFEELVEIESAKFQGEDDEDDDDEEEEE